MERLLTEGYYYTRGPQPSRDRAQAAYEDAVRLDSLNTSGLNNLGVILGREARLRGRGAGVPAGHGATPDVRRGVHQPADPSRSGTGDSAPSTPRWRGTALATPRATICGRRSGTPPGARSEFARADSIGRAVYSRARTSRQAIRSAWGTGSIAYLHGRRREGQHWIALGREALQRAAPSAGQPADVRRGHGVGCGAGGDAALARAVVARGLARYPVESMPAGDRPWENLSYLGGGRGRSGAGAACADRVRSRSGGNGKRLRRRSRWVLRSRGTGGWEVGGGRGACCSKADAGFDARSAVRAGAGGTVVRSGPAGATRRSCTMRSFWGVREPVPHRRRPLARADPPLARRAVRGEGEHARRHRAVRPLPRAVERRGPLAPAAGGRGAEAARAARAQVG